MPIKDLFKGSRYVVSLWLDPDSGECATESFILELVGEEDSDAASLLYEMEKASNHGPSRNEQKFRYLDGAGKGLAEFKARGGSRILCFVDLPRRQIVCCHGIGKLKPRKLAREMEKARAVLDAYQIEVLEEVSRYVN